MTTRILLVRHGQSEWNASGRWQGRADPPLTSVGVEQAVAAGEALGMVDAIVTSSLRRAHHTAAVLAEIIGVGPVEVEERLVERDVGEWTGLTLEEIDRRWPGARSTRRLPPGFEDDAALLERVFAALGTLAARFPGGEVVAVTHGGVMHALDRHLEGEGPRIPNLGARWVEIRAVTGTAEGVRLGARVALLPDAAPLGEREAPPGPTGVGSGADDGQGPDPTARAGEAEQMSAEPGDDGGPT